MRTLRTNRPSRAVLLYVGVCLACWISLVLEILWQHPNPSYGGRDEIKYVLSARMLLDANVQPPSVPQYPPGWPAIMAVNFLRGGDIISGHLLNFGLTCAAVLVVATFWRSASAGGTISGPASAAESPTRVSPFWENPLVPAATAALMFAAHRTTLNLGDKLLSEPLFLVCLGTTFCVLQRGPAKLGQTKVAFALGLLAAACLSVRTAGLAVWAGLSLYYLTARGLSGRQRLVCWLLLSLPVVAFETWLAVAHSRAAAIPGGGYVGQWLERQFDADGSDEAVSAALANVMSHAVQHSRDLASAMIPLPTEFWWPAGLVKLTGVLVAVIALLELAWQVWTRRDATALVLIVYLGIVCLWPYHSVRFFWPIVPFLWFYAYTAIIRWSSGLRWRREKSLRAVPPWALAASAASAFAITAWHPALGRENAMQDLEAFAHALDWIDQRVQGEQPRVASLSCFHVYLLRPEWAIVALPYRDDPTLQRQLLGNGQVQWCVERRNRADKYLRGLQQLGVIREVTECTPVVVYQVARERLAELPEPDRRARHYVSFEP